MTREEYLRRKKEGTCESITVPKIRSRVEYTLAMEGIEDFIGNNKIDYTEEDYEKFDEHFEEIIDFITTDHNPGESDVDKSIEMMEAIGWCWAGGIGNGKTPTFDLFLEEIKKLYETCLNHQCARCILSTGGIEVSIDIYKHQVKVTFGNINEIVYDE